ncbi:hypothetical protein MIR68_003114 [Amoeboaphelidium protococcarum]|nr:hypothetical protein MIR68_003114 [Amoeboaphelidium protococcarum]
MKDSRIGIAWTTEDVFTCEEIQSDTLQVKTTFGTKQRAQLMGIYVTVNQLKRNQIIEIIGIDSTTSKLICSNAEMKTPNRSFFKLDNHDILHSIGNLFKEFEFTPSFEESRSQSLYQDMMENAKTAASQDRTMQYTPQAHHITIKLMHWQNRPIQFYPGRHIKIMHQEKMKKQCTVQLVGLHQNINDINVQNTITTATQGLDSENILDASNTKEIAFRIKFLHKYCLHQIDQKNLNQNMAPLYALDATLRKRHTNTSQTVLMPIQCKKTSLRTGQQYYKPES